jgi:two-component system sensor histidine kinase KdpD
MSEDSRRAFHWFMATLSTLGTSALLVWSGANSTTAGMVFLVLVVWSAAQAGLWPSLYVAILCAISFDYFFLQPIHTFQIVGIQQWVALISFLASCVVAGRLAEQARREALQAQQRREDVERLYTLMQEMMLHDDAAGLVRDLPGLIEHIFSLTDVVLYVLDQDKFHSAAELPEMLRADLRELTIGHISLLTPQLGFEAQALMLGMRPVGALAWKRTSISREVATAISAQVAIALTRAIAVEASARMEASREGERLRAALIDSLTHELRTPLTSIRAAATTLIQGDGLDDTLRLDLAAIVDEEASRLDTLIGEAVEMAEIDAQTVQIHAVSQHTRTLLDHVVEESQSVLTRHSVTIEVEEPDNPAWFDPQLLGRVFRHLIENAARYSPAGSSIVLRSARTDSRLEFCVQDNGPGIDAVDLPMIFEKFYRGKKGTLLGKGTGMGLAIARAILLAHGGSIEAISLPGQGTTFRFWVPLVEKEAAPTSIEGSKTVKAM